MRDEMSNKRQTTSTLQVTMNLGPCGDITTEAHRETFAPRHGPVRGTGTVNLILCLVVRT